MPTRTAPIDWERKVLAHANLSEVVVESLAPIDIERLARCNKACAQTVFPLLRMRKQRIAAAIRARGAQRGAEGDPPAQAGEIGSGLVQARVHSAVR